MDERMKEKHNKRYESEVFQNGETALVQLETVCVGKGALRKRFTIEGKVNDNSSKSDSYKISLICPGEAQQTNLWVPNDNLTNSKKQEKVPKKTKTK